MKFSVKFGFKLSFYGRVQFKLSIRPSFIVTLLFGSSWELNCFVAESDWRGTRHFLR